MSNDRPRQRTREEAKALLALLPDRVPETADVDADAPAETTPPAAGRPPAVHPWEEVLDDAANDLETLARLTNDNPAGTRDAATAAQLRVLRDALATVPEDVAHAIYEAMRASDPEGQRSWVPGGKTQQDEARAGARLALGVLASGPTPPGADARPAAPVTPHDSDCALHNAPAYPAGPCDCTASDAAWDAYAPRWNGCVYICDQGHAHDARDGVACNRASRAAATPPGADA